MVLRVYLRSLADYYFGKVFLVIQTEVNYFLLEMTYITFFVLTYYLLPPPLSTALVRENSTCLDGRLERPIDGLFLRMSTRSFLYVFL